MSRELAQMARPSGLFETERSDRWWVAPLLTAVGFGAFIIYTTFRVFYNGYYLVELEGSAHLLSPFYSPLLLRDSLPSWFSPAIFILWMPAGFRLTCYYYRKAYYRAYMVDPPACSVAEGRGLGYKGETRFFLFQNLHRYMMFLAVFVLIILALDVVYACIWPTEDGPHTFGISLATIIMAINVLLLAFYTFGCHSLRHMVGGKLKCFSCERFGRVRFQAWRWVTRLNEHHMLWAWTSLFTVAFTDFYIWMVAAEIWNDPRIF